MAWNSARALSNRTNRNMLVLALLLGLLSALLSYVYLNDQKTVVSSEGTVVTKPAVVARREIPARTIITSEMVEVRQIAEKAVHPDVFTSTAAVVGQATRFPIAKDEQVLTSKVALSSVLAQEGGRALNATVPLSYVIPTGKRAMSVKVDQVVAAGGLILPGDFVDVIGVFDITVYIGNDVKNTQDLKKYLTMTVLQNVEVLAVAQKVEEVSLASEGDAAKERVPLTRGTAQPDAVTVTLAVTPQQAQTLAKAAEKGSLRLALRPFGDSTEVTVPPLTDVEFLPPTFALPFKQ